MFSSSRFRLPVFPARCCSGWYFEKKMPQSAADTELLIKKPPFQLIDYLCAEFLRRPVPVPFPSSPRYEEIPVVTFHDDEVRGTGGVEKEIARVTAAAAGQEVRLLQVPSRCPERRLVARKCRPVARKCRPVARKAVPLLRDVGQEGRCRLRDNPQPGANAGDLPRNRVRSRRSLRRFV